MTHRLRLTATSPLVGANYISTTTEICITIEHCARMRSRTYSSGHIGGGGAAAILCFLDFTLAADRARIPMLTSDRLQSVAWRYWRFDGTAPQARHFSQELAYITSVEGRRGVTGVGGAWSRLRRQRASAKYRSGRTDQTMTISGVDQLFPSAQ